MLKTFLLTSITLIAFAANSLLTRMALGTGALDAASFVLIRLGSGAIMLLLLTSFTQKKLTLRVKGKWLAALMLFVYALAFSFAYLQLDTGTGALLLFGAVQVTMIVLGLRQGEKPHVVEWVGFLAALGGLVYLVLPGLSAPPLFGSGLMVIAGIAWGIYSLLGKSSNNPIENTTSNFVRSVPLAIGVSLVSLPNLNLSTRGVILAIASGAITSGLGYALWYIALKGLSATQAAIVQLVVPVLAALGGILFLEEVFSLRLGVASLLILGGIAIAVVGRRVVKTT